MKKEITSQVRSLLKDKVAHHLRLAAIKQGLEYSAFDIVHGVNDAGLFTGSLLGIPSDSPADPACIVRLEYNGHTVITAAAYSSNN